MSLLWKGRYFLLALLGLIFFPLFLACILQVVHLTTKTEMPESLANLGLSRGDFDADRLDLWADLYKTTLELVLTIGVFVWSTCYGPYASLWEGIQTRKFGGGDLPQAFVMMLTCWLLFFPILRLNSTLGFDIYMDLILQFITTIFVLYLFKGKRRRYLSLLGLILIHFILVHGIWTLYCLSRLGDRVERNDKTEPVFKLAQQKGFPTHRILKHFHSNGGAYTWTTIGEMIFLGEGLIEQLSKKELTAVMAHELGHHFRNDVIHSILTGIVPLLVTPLIYFYALYPASELYPIFGFLEPHPVAGWIIARSVSIPILVLTRVLDNIIMRKQEYDADDYARGLGMGRPLMMGLAKVGSVFTSTPLYQLFFLSHPSVEERQKHITRSP